MTNYNTNKIHIGTTKAFCYFQIIKYVNYFDDTNFITVLMCVCHNAHILVQCKNNGSCKGGGDLKICKVNHWPQHKHVEWVNRRSQEIRWIVWLLVKVSMAQIQQDFCFQYWRYLDLRQDLFLIDAYRLSYQQQDEMLNRRKLVSQIVVLVCLSVLY